MKEHLTLKNTMAFIERTAWILFLLFLPVTSFPYFPSALGGGTLVRPLSIYPLLILLALSTIPTLFRKPVPKTLLTLLPFVCIAAAVSMLSLLRDIDPLLGIAVPDRVLRAFFTLVIGGAIFATVALTPRTREQLVSSLRWLYAGFSVALLWGSLQAVYIVSYNQAYFRLLQKAQRLLSSRKLFSTRISGMTYEPNWFAEQISMLLVPWLLASVLTGYSIFRWRWRWVTIELLLLIWSVVVLAFTFSRSGLANLFVLAFLGVLFLRPQQRQKEKQQSATTRTWVFRLIQAGIAIVALAGVIYFAGTKNEFFARIWNYWTEKKERSLAGYFEYLGFGARLTYGDAAFALYNEYPVLGVGLGNYAYYFEDFLPDTPLAATPEVLRIVTPDAGRDRLITPKNLYYRLLSETGVVGSAAFMAFVAAVLGCALYLWASPSGEVRYWGKAGLLGMLAFGMAAISFDSFALPNMWVVFGLITASAWVFKGSNTDLQ
jgi:O-antigen ligase